MEEVGRASGETKKAAVDLFIFSPKGWEMVWRVSKREMKWSDLYFKSKFKGISLWLPCEIGLRKDPRGFWETGYSHPGGAERLH